MDFYSGLAPYYDLIFPYDPVQESFLTHVLNPSSEWAGGIRDGKSPVQPNSFLDIGCATGTVLSMFTERFKRLVGIDLNERLLQLAAEKMYPGESGKVELLNGDMTALESLFPEDEFSFITCLGNTLVHLTDPGSVTGFLTQVGNILETEGVFVFQILNYDRILAREIRGLPVILHDDVSFERYYSLPGPDGLISFDTILEDGEKELELQSSTLLNPLKKDKLLEMLHGSGFSHVSFYGDFTGSPWSPESFLTIGVCER